MEQFKDFSREIETSGYLQIIAQDVSEEAKEKYVIVLNDKTGEKYKVPLTTIVQSQWQDLKRVFDGGEAQVLEHVTRIVGYFSKVENWNKSKLGELRDRQQGNYKIK